MENETSGSSASSDSSSLVGHVIRKGVAVLVLALVVAGAYFYLHYTTGAIKAEHAFHHGPGKPPTVSVVKIEPQTIALHPSFLGQTAASRTVEVRARVAGFLQNRLFTEGTRVKKGQMLFHIDPRQFQASLNAAKSQLASDKANLSWAQQQVKRYQKLVKENAATPSELENWQTQADVASAGIEHDKALIDQANLNLSYTDIASPMAGVIGKTHVNAGTYVAPGSNSLLAIVRKVNPIYVNYSVNDAQLLRWEAMTKSGTLKVKDGKMRVALTLADGRKYPHEGTVDFVSVTVDPTTGTADIRAVVPNPDHVLRPGQYVHVKVLGVDQTNAIVVPKSIVHESPAGASVYVVDKANKVESRSVTPGNWYGKRWVIKSGLKPGDLVLAHPLMTVHPGMTVNPQTQETLATGKAATQPTADGPHS